MAIIIDFKEQWKFANYNQRKPVCKLLINAINIHVDGIAEVHWNLESFFAEKS